MRLRIPFQTGLLVVNVPEAGENPVFYAVAAARHPVHNVRFPLFAKIEQDKQGKKKSQKVLCNNGVMPRVKMVDGKAKRENHHCQKEKCR